MAIFRGVGGSGSSSDNSFLQEVTAQATIATNKASEASASATSASASATSAANSLATIQNTEVTSASFNTGDGVLTLTKLGGATVTADLDGRFLTSYTETNDLSSAVTWVNVPNAYITEGSVTQHQAALTITESQISDLQSYLTSYTETNNLTTAVTWANVPDNFITQSSVTQHQAALSITESQISDLQSYLTSETSHADVLVDGDFTSNGFMKRTGAGTYAVDSNTYLTSEANNLTTAVTWANVPDANITQSSVTQHQGALSITESQISDLQTYLTAEANDLSTTVTWANVPDANITQSSVTQHQAALSITESQISDLGTYLTASDITGKANLSGATFTGNVNIGLPPSGTQSLTVAGSSTLYGGVQGGLDVTGDITVTGTVDGRDVAADGAKIDAIGRFGYGESQAKGVSGTTTHTMLTFSVPAPTSGTVVRSINGSVQLRFYLQSSQTPPRNLTYRTYLEMQSTGSTGTSLGTATYSSTPSSYNAWYYVTGNKTDVVSPYRGRIGTSSAGANYSSILGCYYDASANRTYIRVSKYPDAATAYANVEIFYSPTNFYSTGTYVAPYLSNDNYMRLEAINYYDTRLQLFNEIFPRTSSGLYLRMRHRNTTGSTGVSIIAYNNQGYIEATP